MDQPSTSNYELVTNFTWHYNTTTAVPVYSSPDMDLVRIICEVWVSLPLAVLGIIGNILAFVVLCKQHRTTTTVLLQALSVADTLVLISSILLRSLRYVGWNAFNDIHHYIFITVYPCVYFFRLADTWITVLLTIDRYIAVCHPLKAQRICTLRRTYISIAVILVTTLLFSFPRFFEYRFTEEHESIHGFINTKLLRSVGYTVGYRILVFFIVMYLVPMVLLIVLNVRLMFTLRKSISNRAMIISQNTGQNGNALTASDHKTSVSVTIIVATVVTVCILCNLTAMISHVLWSLQLSILALHYLEYYRRFLANVSNVLVTFNCAINFVIYCMFSRKFRSGLREMCTCCEPSLCCQPQLKYQASSATMTTSYSSLFSLKIKNPKLAVTQKSSPDV